MAVLQCISGFEKAVDVQPKPCTIYIYRCFALELIFCDRIHWFSCLSIKWASNGHVKLCVICNCDYLYEVKSVLINFSNPFLPGRASLFSIIDSGNWSLITYSYSSQDSYVESDQAIHWLSQKRNPPLIHSITTGKKSMILSPPTKLTSWNMYL